MHDTSDPLQSPVGSMPGTQTGKGAQRRWHRRERCCSAPSLQPAACCEFRSGPFCMKYSLPPAAALRILIIIIAATLANPQTRPNGGGAGGGPRCLLQHGGLVQRPVQCGRRQLLKERLPDPPLPCLQDVGQLQLDPLQSRQRGTAIRCAPGSPGDAASRPLADGSSAAAAPRMPAQPHLKAGHGAKVVIALAVVPHKLYRCRLIRGGEGRIRPAGGGTRRRTAPGERCIRPPVGSSTRRSAAPALLAPAQSQAESQGSTGGAVRYRRYSTGAGEP